MRQRLLKQNETAHKVLRLSALPPLMLTLPLPTKMTIR
jgi:hypothetical protein